MLDIDDLPIGTRVQTPSGRVGVVIKHKGAQSKQDHFQRCLIKLDGGARHDQVTLQPHLLVKLPPAVEVSHTIHEQLQLAI